MLSHGAQSGQAEHHVAELSEVNYEDVFEFRMLLNQADILQHSKVIAGHLRRFFDTQNTENCRGDIS